MKKIAGNKGHTIVHQLSAWDPVLKRHTNAAAAGIAARGFFSLTPDGDPIDATVTADLGVADAQGYVQGPVPGAGMIAHILPLAGQVVYEIVEATPPGSGVYRDYLPYTVVKANLVGGAEV